MSSARAKSNRRKPCGTQNSAQAPEKHTDAAQSSIQLIQDNAPLIRRLHFLGTDLAREAIVALAKLQQRICTLEAQIDDMRLQNLSDAEREEL